MVKDDILSGLKNAIDKGFSLQSVVASFINAGYSPDEVNQAARQINMGVLGQMNNGVNQTPRVVMKDNLDAPPYSTNSLPVLPEVKKELYVPEPAEVNQVKKLPTDGSTLIDHMERKKGIPGYLIALIIFFIILIVGAGIFMLFGNQILDTIFFK